MSRNGPCFIEPQFRDAGVRRRLEAVGVLHRFTRDLNAFRIQDHGTVIIRQTGDEEIGMGENSLTLRCIVRILRPIIKALIPLSIPEAWIDAVQNTPAVTGFGSRFRDVQGQRNICSRVFKRSRRRRGDDAVLRGRREFCHGQGAHSGPLIVACLEKQSVVCAQFSGILPHVAVLPAPVFELTKDLTIVFITAEFKRIPSRRCRLKADKLVRVHGIRSD